MSQVEMAGAPGVESVRIEDDLAAAAAMTAAFNGELAHLRDEMSETAKEAGFLSRNMGGELRRAFDGVVFDGMRTSDALNRLGRSILDNVYDAAMQPVQDALGGALTNGINSLFSAFLPFSEGGVFGQGRVVPFARGGVVSGPVAFPMRKGIGLMGEAGPEAIMPLSRGADGRLGIRAESDGGRAVNVVMNISTPDAEGFRRSQSQIAAELGRVIGRGQRNR